MADRDSNGRFVKGHKVSVGNKGGGRARRSTEERYLRALSDRVTPEDWIKIIDVAMANAKAGDKAARQWLSSYLIGLPTQYVSTDITSLGEKLAAPVIYLPAVDKDGDVET